VTDHWPGDWPLVTLVTDHCMARRCAHYSYSVD